MIGDTRQSQTSGDSSQNFQANTINIVATDEQTIRSIVDRQMAERLAILSGQAFDTYKTRCNDFADGLIYALDKLYSAHVERLREPSVQIAINEAQKAYGESGNEDLKAILIDIVGRMCSAPSDTLDRIFKDAVSVVKRLTTRQLNFLTIHTVLLNITHRRIDSFSSYISSLIANTAPFVDKMPIKQVEISYLEDIGVGRYNISSNKIKMKIRSINGGFFQNGLSSDILDEIPADKRPDRKYFIPCMHNPDLLQVAFRCESAIREEVDDPATATTLCELLNRSMMADTEIDEAISRVYPPWREIMRIFGELKGESFFVTTIGQALSVINLEVKAGVKIGLDVWL